MIDVRFRPLREWPGKRTPASERGPKWTFKADYQNTLNLLERELSHLAAKNIVIEAGFSLGQIRNDGWPYGAASPSDCAVIVRFDSKHGPLSLPCDHFSDWRHNLRAIAMHLENLRHASLYGIGRMGEQYRGWKQLEAPAAAMAMQPDQASALLGAYVTLPPDALLAAGTQQDLADAYKIAARRTHPDRGGSVAEFQRVNEAKRVLDQFHGGKAAGA